jgi:ferredoxin
VSTTLIAMSVAFLLAFGLIVTVVALNLLTGSAYFLFGQPKFKVLKSKNGKNSLAFGFAWNSAREPAKLDTVSLRLFNPFGSPTQVEVSQRFEAKSDNFALDIDMGPGLVQFFKAQGFEKAIVQIQVYSSTEGLNFQFEKRGDAFLHEFNHATLSVEDFLGKNKVADTKIYYQIPSRSFVAENLGGSSSNSLKLATNPAFAGEFTSGAAEASAGAAKTNYAVSKVWIEPGCIVCNACEGIYPEVFEVTETTCLIRPGAPLENGLLIQEAAEACPVEVIKFTKVS